MAEARIKGLKCRECGARTPLDAIYVCEEFGLVREWWVKAEFRRRGAGRALLRHAAAELAAAGVVQLRVRTAARDADTRKMLRRCGFRRGPAEMIMDLEPNDSTRPSRTEEGKQRPRSP